MSSGKNEVVYAAGLAIVTLWDVAQMWLVRDNDVLLFFSLLTLLVTVYGDYVTLTDQEEARRTWMLWYTIPAGLIGFASAQGWYEIQNNVLASAQQAPMPSPMGGTSLDYIDAAYSHYGSMLAPAGVWLIAHLVPIAGRMVARIRANRI